MAKTGRFYKTSIGGEEVLAFVPDPLPPQNGISLSSKHRSELVLAEKNLSQLEVAADMLPSLEWFIYAFVRKEAVLSSQIEGTQCTLVDLLRFEAEVGDFDDDVEEVCNYLDALKFAREELKKPKGLPLSMRLLNTCHGFLMQGVRGKNKRPGEVRSSQNWIGGTRPGNAHFVPPPPHLLSQLLSDFEKYIHAQDDTPLLVKCALLHVQFETIHPYLDGNGRIGRLLVTLLLEEYGFLCAPLLYLSLFLKRNRAAYYGHLSAVRKEGDWAGWIAFFLEGIGEIAKEATESARDIFRCIEEDRTKVLNSPSSTIMSLRLFESLSVHPILNIQGVTKRMGTSKPTAMKAVDQLMALGILMESTGRKRDKVFRYETYLNHLNTGT